MRRLTVTAVLVFAGLVCEQAAAQDIPEQVRRDIHQALGAPFIVFREKAQEDLKLSDEQRSTLDKELLEQVQETMPFLQKLEGLKPIEREKELNAYRQKAQEKLAKVVKETLQDDQRKRLRQLVLQQEGTFAVLSGGMEIGSELKITVEQRKQLMAVALDMQKKAEPLINEAQAGGKAEEIWPKILKIRKEHEGKLNALLTDAQKKQWKEMLGAPLDLGE